MRKSRLAPLLISVMLASCTIALTSTTDINLSLGGSVDGGGADATTAHHKDFVGARVSLIRHPPGQH